MPALSIDLFPSTFPSVTTVIFLVIDGVGTGTVAAQDYLFSYIGVDRHYQIQVHYQFIHSIVDMRIFVTIH